MIKRYFGGKNVRIVTAIRQCVIVFFQNVKNSAEVTSIENDMWGKTLRQSPKSSCFFFWFFFSN